MGGWKWSSSGTGEPRGLCVRDLDPLVRLRRIENRVQHQLRLIRVTEVRPGALTLTDRVQEVGDLMDEAVLVADLQAGDPPLVHVGVLAAVVGHVNRAPA